MLKLVKNVLFLLFVQASLTCASSNTPTETKETFLFKGREVELVTGKPLVALKVNSPMGSEIATIFDEFKMKGVKVWIGYHVPRMDADPISGLHYNRGAAPQKLVEGDFGFFQTFEGLHFAFVSDRSDQHRTFSTIYLLTLESDGSVWAQRLYVLAGTLIDAVVIGNDLVFSGTEMGEPFAAYINTDAHLPSVHRLELAGNHEDKKP